MKLLAPFITMICLSLLLASNQLLGQIQDFFRNQTLVSNHALGPIVISLIGISVISFAIWVFRN